MADIRTDKIEAAKEKLPDIQRAMNKGQVVYYEGKPYYIQALRLPKSALYGGAVYQAELVSVDPLRWNSVIIVALEKVEVANENNGIRA